jgi:hypothetical protein
VVPSLLCAVPFHSMVVTTGQEEDQFIRANVASLLNVIAVIRRANTHKRVHSLVAVKVVNE